MDKINSDNQIINPNDNSTPFSDPNDVQSRVDDTHPHTDSNVDPDEQYQEGLSEAAEVFDPEKADPTDDDLNMLMEDTH